MQVEGKEYLTVREAAVRARVHRQTIYRAVWNGELKPASEYPFLIKPAALSQWISRRDYVGDSTKSK